MDWKKFKKSFVYAMRGIGELWRKEQNFRIEVIIAIFVIVMSFVWDLRIIEKAILILIILIVLGSEAINTVMENLLDGINREINPYFRTAKDILAGITLVSAIGAVLIGFIIFYPYLLLVV